MNSKPVENQSRRAVLAGALAGAAGIALGSRLALAAASASSLPLITKPIPSTGEKLPVVGIGTNQYSVTAPEEIAARREVLEHLPRLGGKLVDTAWRYGDAEIVIGNLVKQLGNRDELFIATKTATPGEVPGRNGPGAGLHPPADAEDRPAPDPQFPRASRSCFPCWSMPAKRARSFTTEITAMSFRKNRTRAPYASVLYAAAVAALLSACSQSAVEPAASTTTIHLSESSSDMPEVVVTASREQPKAIG
ncbi:MAG: aldo/keto reductase [Gammaproteobacteria bacterium]